MNGAGYVLGELTGKEGGAIDDHLRLCPACRRLGIITRFTLGVIAAGGGKGQACGKA